MAEEGINQLGGTTTRGMGRRDMGATRAKEGKSSATEEG
jgi:hypothetical protein